jgi:hypothetical protein
MAQWHVQTSLLTFYYNAYMHGNYFHINESINKVTAHVTLTRQRIFKYYQIIKIRESSGRSPYKQKHRKLNQSKVIAHAQFVIKPSTLLQSFSNPLVHIL